jgi:hypothetical protein
MRWPVVLAAVLIAASAARAASPEEGYLAARDKALAAMKKLETAQASDAKMQATETAAFADLLKRLVPIVGPVSVKGFPHPPRVNLETLGDGPGNNMLDGLSFEADPDKPDGARLVVTTKPLFVAWAKASAADAADTADRLPEAAEEAMRSDNFYTGAIGSDAGFSRGLEIEVEKPAGADFAFAALGRWAQDVGPSPLDRIVAGVIKGGRIFVADVDAAAKAPELPACKAVWDAANAKADKLVAADKKGGNKDQKLVDESEKIQEKGNQDWLDCEGQAVKAGATYPALKKEAQDLLARMAGG